MGTIYRTVLVIMSASKDRGSAHPLHFYLIQRHRHERASVISAIHFACLATNSIVRACRSKVMKTTPVLGMISSLLRIRRHPQCLALFRQRILAGPPGTKIWPWKHSHGQCTNIHTSKKILKDLEGIEKAVMTVTSKPDRMAPVDRRKALAHLDADDKKTARKKIKLALRQRREDSMAANRQRQKEAGGAPLAMLPENVGRKQTKSQKKK